MRKIALFSLLMGLLPCIVFAGLPVVPGTYTDVSGMKYVVEKGLIDGKVAFKGVWANGKTEFWDSKGKFTQIKGRFFQPDNPTPQPSTTVSSGGKVNGVGIAAGVLSTVTGVVTMHDSVEEKGEKTTFGDIAKGAAGGAMTTAGLALIVNSVPFAGQVAYGTAVVVGAVAGASGAGLKMFSETDCALDEILSQYKGFNVYQCCHTSQKLSQITNANYWDIGAYMFCPEPGMVSQCMQGDASADQGFSGLFKDDHWSSCKEKWCSGWEKPKAGTEVQYYADYDNYCWKWECVKGTRQGNVCDCLPNQERATKNITSISACTGSACTPVVADQCYDKKYLKCMEAIDEKIETKITWNGQDCVCTDDNKTFDYDLKKCVVKKGKGGGDKKITPSDCKTYSGDQKLFKCCEAAKKKNPIVTFDKGICKCIDENKDFDGEQCVGSKSGGEVSCRYEFNKELTCGNYTYTRTHRVDLSAEDCAKAQGRFAELFARDISLSRKYEDLLCLEYLRNGIEPDKKGPSATELQKAKTVVSNFTAGAKGDVWKDAEGNFNTARLASDLTAGVVLGTVGGVVSGVVIKKKQVEKGFDALHCTVGGQKIADWGDTFSVGLRR